VPKPHCAKCNAVPRALASRGARVLVPVVYAPHGKLNEVEITIAIQAVLIIYVDFAVRCPEAKPGARDRVWLAYDGMSEEYWERVKPEQTLVTKENKYEDVCYAWAAEDWSEYSKCKPACGVSSQATSSAG
jgi:hypothetical protein